MEVEDKPRIGIGDKVARAYLRESIGRVTDLMERYGDRWVRVKFEPCESWWREQDLVIISKRKEKNVNTAERAD